MTIPDITVDYCEYFSVSARLNLPSEANNLFKKQQDRLTHIHELKQARGWVHLWVALRKPKAGEIGFGFTVGMHSYPAPTDGKEKRPRGWGALIGRIGKFAEKAEFDVLGRFYLPKKEFKTKIVFPNDVSVGLGGGTSPNVRVAGLRVEFIAGPLKSMIIDGSEDQIYFSPFLKTEMEIKDSLPAAAFDQLRTIVQSLVTKDS